VYRTTSPYRVPRASPTNRSRAASMNSRFLMRSLYAPRPRLQPLRDQLVDTSQISEFST
jgi:hypothetical protein